MTFSFPCQWYKIGPICVCVCLSELFEVQTQNLVAKDLKVIKNQGQGHSKDQGHKVIMWV